MRRAKLLGAFGICGELFDSLKIIWLQLALQLVLSGQISEIFGCKNLVVVFGQGVLDDGIALVSTENDADGRISRIRTEPITGRYRHRSAQLKGIYRPVHG